MGRINRETEIIYNNGERLIPGVTHDLNEFIRHRNSYLFFRDVIKRDLLFRPGKLVTIIDLGCGVGHGCATMAEIQNSSILGVDNSSESLEYAEKHYAKENIQYRKVDLTAFVSNMPEHDYVVSRGVLEHVPNGINLAFLSKWKMRLIFDVPYAEPAGRNPHHIIHDINEQTFAGMPGVELFYEDLDGNIYDSVTKPLMPNLIMCVVSSPDLPRVGSFIKFPYYAYKTLDEKIALKFRSVSWNNVAPILNGILHMPVKAARRFFKAVRSFWTTERKK